MGGVNRPVDRPPVALSEQIADLSPGFTYYEIGVMLHRKPKTIKNLVCKYKIKNRMIRTSGRKKIYVAVVDAEGVRQLRRIIHNF